MTKQKSRYDKQHDEERIQGQYTQHAKNFFREVDLGLSDNYRDHGNGRLGARRREQGARHSPRPEARAGSADDPDEEHTEIQHINGVILTADDADGKIQPDKEECRRHRDAHSGPVRGIARLPRYQLISEATAKQERAGDNEIEQSPVYFIGELHRHQGHQQYERCHERDPDNVFIFHFAIT